MIAKGTTVTVRTINGGELTAVLLEDYRPTFEAVLERHNRSLVISPWRIDRVEIAASKKIENSLNSR